MKILIRYYNQWGNQSTKCIVVPPSSSVADFKNRIHQHTEIEPAEQLLLLNDVALEDGKLLSDYVLDEGCFIYVKPKTDVSSSDALDQGEDLTQELIQQQQQFAPFQHRYLQKLGIVQEDDQEEEEEDNKAKRSVTQRSHQELLQEFINCVKNQNWDNAQTILTDCAKLGSYIHSNSTTMERYDLINDRSFTGWNSLHYACYLGYDSIVRELLLNGADVNLPSKDGYSALQLAIQKCKVECALLLLKQANCDVNYVGNERTALQIAVLKGELDIVEQILNHPRFQRNLVNLELLQGDAQAISLVKSRCKVIEAKKPSAIKGYCKKVNVFKFFHYKRYFVLDPDSGTLTRYKTESDYPITPVETIALTSILSVGYPQIQWYMKSDHHYLNQIMYKKASNEILLICSTNQKTIQSWKAALEEAIIYYKELEKGYSNVQNQGFDAICNIMVATICIPDNFATINDSRCGTLQEEQIEALRTADEEVKSPQRKQTSPKNNSGDYTIRLPSANLTNLKPLPQAQKVQEEPPKQLQPKVIAHLAQYTVAKQIGQGAFGKVFLVRFNPSGQIYAMKQLNKRRLIQKKQVKFAVTECNVLKQVECPYIVNLFQSFQTPHNLYLVMDYCGGGDLSYHLSKKRKFSEALCKVIMRQVMKAIEYLHSQNIIYRDLKPENILIDNKKRIKLVDFGLSKQTELGTAKTFCGSPAYLAPEVLNNDGSKQASDIYGCGTVLYEMLTGDPPFFNEDVDTLFENIKTENLKIPSNLSKPCQQLLTALLQKEPSKRIGCRKPEEVNWSQIKKAEWLEWDKADEDFPFCEKMEDLQQVVSNFQMNIGDVDYEEDNKNINRIAKWTFTRPFKEVNE